MAAAAMLWPRPEAPARPEPVPFRADQAPHPTAAWFDVSPDGTRIVYRREGAAGGSELWARALDEADAWPISGTEGAALPAISPDGLEVAFADTEAPARIRIVPLRGGAGRTVADSAATGPVRWSPDGAWVYYTGAELGLRRAPAAGGLAEVLTRIEPARTGEAHWPAEVLPGGDAVVYTAAVAEVEDARVEVLSLPSGERRDLWSGSSARYSPSTGRLLFADPVEPVVMAVAFDAERLELRGAPGPVLRGVARHAGWPLFALSADGTLVYGAPLVGAEVAPVWVDRTGAVSEIDAAWSYPGLPVYSSLALAPDDDRLAASLPDEDGAWHLWVEPLGAAGAPPVRLTREGRLNYRPTWSADGRSLTFISDRGGGADLWRVPVDGGASAERVLHRAGVIRNGFYSADGAWLVFREGEAPVADIFAASATDTADVIPLVVTGSGERSPALSPDGRWLAYTSNESGEWQVWVTPFPDGGSERWRVSPAGGEEPLWAHSGRELFYRSLANELVSVSVDDGPRFHAGAPRVLFSMDRFLGSDGRAQYDVSADDERFVMLRLEERGRIRLMRIEGFAAGTRH